MGTWQTRPTFFSDLGKVPTLHQREKAWAGSENRVLAA
jgi:hypothetical protein